MSKKFIIFSFSLTIALVTLFIVFQSQNLTKKALADNYDCSPAYLVATPDSVPSGISIPVDFDWLFKTDPLPIKVVTLHQDSLGTNPIWRWSCPTNRIGANNMCLDPVPISAYGIMIRPMSSPTNFFLSSSGSGCLEGHSASFTVNVEIPQPKPAISLSPTSFTFNASLASNFEPRTEKFSIIKQVYSSVGAVLENMTHQFGLALERLNEVVGVRQSLAHFSLSRHGCGIADFSVSPTFVNGLPEQITLKASFDQECQPNDESVAYYGFENITLPIVRTDCVGGGGPGNATCSNVYDTSGLPDGTYTAFVELVGTSTRGGEKQSANFTVDHSNSPVCSGNPPYTVTCDCYAKDTDAGPTSCQFRANGSGTGQTSEAARDACKNNCIAEIATGDRFCSARNYICIGTQVKPIISLVPSLFKFAMAQGASNPLPQTLRVTNSGPAGTILSWSAVVSTPSWLSVSPSQGNGLGSGASTNITVSVNATGMPVGTHNGIITVSDPNASNSPQTATVELIITQPQTRNACLFPSPPDHDFGTAQIPPHDATYSVELRNERPGDQGSSFTITSCVSNGWITVTSCPTGQVVTPSQSAYMTVRVKGLKNNSSVPTSPGTHTANVTVNTSPGDGTLMTPSCQSRNIPFYYTIPTPPISCSASAENVNVNDSVTYSVIVGEGPFTWTVPQPNSNSCSGGGATCTTSFQSTGPQNVIVNGVVCPTVTVTSLPALKCTPVTNPPIVKKYPQSSLSNPFTSKADGGNNVYSWSVPRGSPSTGNGTNFTTSFTEAGNQYVNVFSDIQSASCVADVRELSFGIQHGGPVNCGVDTPISFTACLNSKGLPGYPAPGQGVCDDPVDTDVTNIATWTSDNPSLVTSLGNGRFHAKNDVSGTATIHASYDSMTANGQLQVSCGSDFGISVVPNTQNAPQGGQTTYSVTAINADPAHPYTGSISLSVYGLPTGVSAPSPAFSNNVITTNGVASILTLKVSPKAPYPGPFDFYVSGMGSDGKGPHDEVAHITISCVGPSCVPIGGCTPPDENPHNVCLKNSCVSVPGCGSSVDCSTCGGTPGVSCDFSKGESNPYRTCIKNQCIQIYACGISVDCSTCGGPEPPGDGSNPVTCDAFTATPNRLIIPPQGTVKLHWESTFAKECSITNKNDGSIVGSNLAGDGEINVRPSETTAYQLKCTNSVPSICDNLETKVRVFDPNLIEKLPR
jgi:hypothetical protein